MNFGKIGYYAGIIVGFALVYGVYGLGLYGVFSSILNREIPYIPIILILSVYSARKLFQIQIYLLLRAQIEANGIRQAAVDNDVKKMMSRVIRSNGVN